MPLGKERMRKAFESATNPTVQTLEKALDSFQRAITGLAIVLAALTMVIIFKVVSHGV